MLVPVDLSFGAASIVEKIAGIAKDFQCSIHLVHVTKPASLGTFPAIAGTFTANLLIAENNEKLQAKMREICHDVKEVAGADIHVSYSVLKGAWNETLIEMIREYNFDLVVYIQKGKIFARRRMIINPDKIAERAGIPILTLPSNRRFVKLCSIIIPITDFLPVRKIMYAIYIAKGCDTTVKLVGIENRKTKNHLEHYLKKAYHAIHDNCSLNVELDTIPGNNIATAINQFAMVNSSDLIILNPGTQTKIPGIISSLMGRIIQRYAAPPVLTVSPN